MLDNLEFDDSDSPAIGLVPPGVSWDQVRDHIKIAHHSLLVPPPADGARRLDPGAGRISASSGSRPAREG